MSPHSLSVRPTSSSCPDRSWTLAHMEQVCLALVCPLANMSNLCTHHVFSACTVTGDAYSNQIWESGGRRGRSRSKRTGLEGEAAELADLQQSLAPRFEHFHWHRVVLDEANEMVCVDSLYERILSLKCKFTWYVSGTPFVNKMSYGIISLFLSSSLYIRYIFNVSSLPS